MSLLLLAIAFVTTGLTMIATKLIVELGLGAYSLSFVMLSAGSAAVAAGVPFAVTRPRIERKDVVVGLLMGATGAMAMATLMQTLRYLPGVVVFPVRASANIALTAGLSCILWREQLTPRQWLGVALAVAAVYLLV